MSALGSSVGAAEFLRLCCRPVRGRRLAQYLTPVAVFGAAVGVAELAGAINLGTAFGIGQIFFAIALVYVLLRL